MPKEYFLSKNCLWPLLAAMTSNWLPFTLAYFLDQNGHFVLCVYINCTIGKFWEFQIRNLFRTHLWHFQQTSSWLLWGPTRPNHDWWCQYPLEGGSWTAKEARNVNSFYFPQTSLLLQNPYLKIAKKKIENATYPIF